MVGVAEDHFASGGTGLVWGDAFDAAAGADAHEGGCLKCAVGSGDGAGAGEAVAVGDGEGDGHGGEFTGGNDE